MKVKFNGINLPDFIRVVGLSFSAISDITGNESSLPHKVGNYDPGITRGGLAYDLNIQLVDTDKSMFQMRRELKTWLKGNNWKPSRLEFEENSDKFNLARIGSDPEINDLFTHGETDIQFYCADPKEYDKELTEETYSGSDFTVAYEGIEETSTVLEITLEKDYPNLSLKHLETGDTVNLTSAFESGQKVTVDSDRKLIKVNDTTAMNILNFNSNWLYLETGLNEFDLYSTQSGQKTEVEASIKITYRKAD